MEKTDNPISQKTEDDIKSFVEAEIETESYQGLDLKALEIKLSNAISQKR